MNKTTNNKETKQQEKGKKLNPVFEALSKLRGTIIINDPALLA